MDRRRLAGLVGLVVIIAIVAALTYFDSHRSSPDGTEAFAPAQSADESVPAGDTPIVAPTDLGAAKPDADGKMAAETPAPGGSMSAEAPAASDAPAVGDMAAKNSDAVSQPAEKLAAEAPPAAGDGAAPPAPNSMAAEAPKAETPAPGTGMAAAETPAEKMTAEAPKAETPAAGAGVTTAETPAPAKTPDGGMTAEAPKAEAKAPGAIAMAEPPANAEAKPETAMPVAPPVVPTFDVVRVEPTGETVVAGTADPEATVEILDGVVTIASAEANDRGEWALALDQALGPGSHDLAVRTTSKDRAVATLSDQRVAVSVPERGSKDVLVVLNAPDAPSRVLQVPTTEEKTVRPAEPQVATTAEPSPTQPKTEEPAKETTPATAQAAATPDKPAEAKPAAPATAQAAATPDKPAETKPAKTSEPKVAETPAVSEKPAEPSKVAEAPAAKPPAPPKPTPEVVVSAVEADTAGMLFIAGTAATGEPVRVYLGDEVLGEAKPSPSGTWLVEVHRELVPGNYEVRADQIADSSGKVIARAEVPFEREVVVASLKATGSTGAGATAQVSGKAPKVETIIIKRGDNLWRIARDAWGKGIRWSTVYQANKDQIRNPHWIYPGQVFVMPTTPDVAKN